MQALNHSAPVTNLSKMSCLCLEKNVALTDKLADDLVSAGTLTHSWLSLSILENQNDEPDQSIQDHRCFRFVGQRH